MSADETVSFGTFDTPPFHDVHVSMFKFEDTVDRLKVGMEAEDLWLIHEIDPQALLRRGGLTIPATRQILFFHPRLMKRILTTCPDAIIEAPLKIVVQQVENGTVSVRHLSVADQFNRYAGLEELSSHIAASYRRIISHIV